MASREQGKGGSSIQVWGVLGIATPSLVPPTPGPQGPQGMALLSHGSWRASARTLLTPKTCCPLGPHPFHASAESHSWVGVGADTCLPCSSFTKGQGQEWPTGSVHVCVCAHVCVCVCVCVCVQPREEPCQRLSGPGGPSAPHLLGGELSQGWVEVEAPVAAG